jgi:hypothetical protein
VEKSEPSYTAKSDCKMVQPLWDAVWQLPKVVIIEPPHKPATLLLGGRKSKKIENQFPHNILLQRSYAPKY